MPEASHDRSRSGSSRPTRDSATSSHEIANHHFDVACDRLGLPDDEREVMRTSYREIRVQIPVRLSDDKIHVYSGYRV